MENNMTLTVGMNAPMPAPLNGSLDLMHDIIVPPAVSFFPMASGWILVLALLFVFAVHKGWQTYLLYKKNLYRREALHELETLKNRTDSAQTADLLRLMKRVALQHFGRDEVAALSHDAWWDFIESHSKVKIDAELRMYCEKTLYASRLTPDIQSVNEIKVMTSLWIKTHKGGKS